MQDPVVHDSAQCIMAYLLSKVQLAHHHQTEYRQYSWLVVDMVVAKAAVMSCRFVCLVQLQQVRDVGKSGWSLVLAIARGCS